MLARVLALTSFVQAAAIVLPALSWPLWMVHFAAVEGCLLGAVLGLAAILLTHERWVTAAASLGALICILPALSVIPAYLREGQSFSPWLWLTGGGVPAVTLERDVVLGGTVTADLWRGRGEGPRPAVVVVHGGSWRSGDKGEIPHMSAVLADAGYTVVDVRYRLAGTAPFPPPSRMCGARWPRSPQSPPASGWTRRDWRCWGAALADRSRSSRLTRMPRSRHPAAGRCPRFAESSRCTA